MMPTSDEHSPAIRVGLLGCGNVGGALAGLILNDSAGIESRSGLRLELAKVAVRSTTRDRSVTIPTSLLTNDPGSVVASASVDVVVELIGGIEPARSLILEALKARKPVVTANKELLANCGAELYEAAANAGVDLLFEASVAGGIPLIRALRESLAGEGITRVMGIVNGTTNYILSRMSEAGDSYHDALADAQGLGYAERDPTADVEGYDAAAKAAILAQVAFGARVVAGDVYREGISSISSEDIAVASRLGYAIKLLAVVESEDGAVAVRVHPAMIPLTHPLASVRDSFNAVFIEGSAVGQLMLLGRGAGGMPTASAVLGDILDAAHNLRSGVAGRIVALRKTKIRPIDDLRSEYYVTMEVEDRPGVLAAVAGVLGRHQVSIRSMEQPGRSVEHSGDSRGSGAPEAKLVFMTHLAQEADMQACLHELRQLDAVDRIGGLMRVIEQR
jgi:homoserine dehydrogenase